MKIFEDSNIKCCYSPDYNYIFNKKTGLFARWGKTQEEDPTYASFGPEIADIEISTICHGINGKPCSWCYKSNGFSGKNMSFEMFKNIFHKLPKTLTQIAFGIGDIDSNPDMFSIFEYCRNNEYNFVVPNVTINGDRLTKEYAIKLSKLCGAVACSHYNHDDICFGAVEYLSKYGLRQVNIHKLLSLETYDDCFKLIDRAKTDKRLINNLNAIVFLLLKPKGKRNKFNPLSNEEQYKKLVEYAFDKEISFGFDSCSAGKFLNSIKGHNKEKELSVMAEPCESTRMSIYINVDGFVFPCSFMDGEKDWERGLDVVNCVNFEKDIWYNERAVQFRNSLTDNHKCNNFNCPYFKNI